MPSLEGKVALVTGGSRGIGAAIAQRLAEEQADIALTYNANPDRAEDVVTAITQAGSKAVAIQAPATESSSVVAAVERTVAELGRIDILVNNAGIFPYGPFEDFSVEDFDNAIAIHAKSAFVAAQAVVGHMPSGGRIINIGSNLVDYVPIAGITLYTLSKSALIGFTKGLARELGPRDITVNLVNPGNTDTEMNPDDSSGTDPRIGLIALGRYGQATDIAATVTHLAGESGRYITGTAITVDGGLNA